VLYTNYGGISEFMEEGFFPVSYNLTQVGENHHEAGPYDKSAWWAEPDLDDAERQLRRALGVSANGDLTASIAVDRKKLQENLVAAQHEVVSSALRLMKLEPRDDGPDDSHLIVRLEAHPKVIDGEFQKTTLNPILFALVAVMYGGYKLLPARVRHQCSSALNKLRN
jgi:hypothetical protein